MTSTSPPAASTPASSVETPLLEVRNLRAWFPIRSGVLKRMVGHIHAVDGVDLQIRRGETLGLVGESGCGKTTLARTLMGVVPPTSGEILFQGEDLTRLSGSKLRRRRREMAMIFQDPYASLDPRQTVGDIIGEPLDIHGLYRGHRRQERIYDLLDMVGLSRRFANRYPHQFSGGQRQRIGIARALAVDAKFVVCDEPISALDVSIQAQIINLLERLQERLDLTYLFIAHDLSVVKHISDRIAVMYLGKVVEGADAAELYRYPKHPYTSSLLSAVPIPDPKVEKHRRRIILQGDIPSPANPPSGCRFRTRCFKAQDRCAHEEPPFGLLGPREHRAACWFPME